MRAVARHQFVPVFWDSASAGGIADVERHATVDDASAAAVSILYDADRAVALQPGGAGKVTSTASAPGLVAAMLDLLGIEPGMRVLEIGTGSGWNAALLAHLVGPAGAVVSIDIDAELVEAARPRLAAAGFGNVTVMATDGARGAPELAPFDRVVATVGCDDVSPAWLAQLRADGLALVPLHHAGMDPLVELRRDSSGRRGRGRFRGVAWFVAVQGDLEAGARRRGEWRLPAEVQDDLLRTRGGGSGYEVELVPVRERLPAPAPGELGRLHRRHHVEIIRYATR